MKKGGNVLEKTQADNSGCSCMPVPALIFQCSGASDASRVAELAAGEKSGRMYCPAGTGGDGKEITASAGCAEKIPAIDGCKLDCAKNILLRADFRELEHLRLSFPELKKGEIKQPGRAVIRVRWQVRDCLKKHGRSFEPELSDA